MPSNAPRHTKPKKDEYDNSVAYASALKAWRKAVQRERETAAGMNDIAGGGYAATDRLKDKAEGKPTGRA
jgi:hypothetical protein